MRATDERLASTGVYADKDTNKRGQKQTRLRFAEREYLRGNRKYEKVWEANNLWLRGAHNKRRIAAEEETDRKVYLLLKFFSLCFWLDPKAPKDQARRKVAGVDTRAR